VLLPVNALDVIILRSWCVHAWMKDVTMAKFRRVSCFIKQWLAVGLGLGFGFVCPTHAESSDRADEIRIGMVNARSGPVGFMGEGMLQGASAVFNEVNANGGIFGRKIVLRVADDAYEPEQTLEHTIQMIDDEKVLALFGYVGTATVNAILPLLGEQDVPLIGVISGSQSLRKPIVRQVFNLRASYWDEVDALVDRLMTNGAKKIAVVYQNDGFGLSVLSGVDRSLLRHGMLVHSTGSFQRNTTAIRMALSTMVEQQPDAIVLAGTNAPVVEFIKQARGLGVKAQFATLSFVGTERLLENLGSAGQGVLISQVVPYPGDNSDWKIVGSCRKALKQQLNAPLNFTSFEACISARLLVLALEKAGPQLSREALRNSLESMRALDLDGMAINFSADNHQASDRVFLTQIRNGKIVQIR